MTQQNIRYRRDERIDAAQLDRILRKTMRTLEQQSHVPRSPGDIAEGRPNLCSGAALVYHAAAMGGEARAADAIAWRMVRGGKKQILREAVCLGLDARFVARAIINNDALDDADRRASMISFFGAAAARGQAANP